MGQPLNFSNGKFELSRLNAPPFHFVQWETLEGGTAETLTSGSATALATTV